MKLCPNCKTTYSDDSLLYCLSDGTNLVAMPSPEKTVEMSAASNPIRFDIQSDSAPTVFAPRISQPQNENVKRGISPWLVIPLLGILLLSVVALLGYIFLKPNSPAISNSATPTPTAPPKDETAALKEELESLKKQIANQKTQPKNDSPTRPFPNGNSSSAPITQTARANSPNDGFLALRSLPDSEAGSRLAKIPHGTNLEIIGCQKNEIQLSGKRRGRWCRTTFEGQSGWVFDAFLSF